MTDPPATLFGRYLIAGWSARDGYYCRGQTRLLTIAGDYGESVLSFPLRSKLRESKEYVLLTDADLRELVEGEAKALRMAESERVENWYREE